MSDEVLAIIAGIVSFWEDSTGAELIQAYPADWNPEVLHAEWYAQAQGQYRKPRREFRNGTSATPADIPGHLRDLIRNVEQTHRIVIDHLIVKKSEGRLSVLWHLPGEQVRRHGYVAIAANPAPADTSKRVEAE